MSDSRQALLCFDGSEDAVGAIAAAGELLSCRTATVIVVWEPVSVWAPYDPGAVLSAGMARLASDELGLDDIAEGLARVTMEKGVGLAGEAGFSATGLLTGGKPWRAICEAAEELDVSLIVLGARGLSRVQSALLGSVSAAVATHASRPVLTVPRPHE